jgi:hypothetical protein
LTEERPRNIRDLSFSDQSLFPTAGFDLSEGRGMTVRLNGLGRFPGYEALAGQGALSGSPAVIIVFGFVRRAGKRLRNRGEHGDSGCDDQ